MKVRTSVKAGKLAVNHNQTSVQVRTAVKAGQYVNHNETAIKVQTAVRAGTNTTGGGGHH